MENFYWFFLIFALQSDLITGDGEDDAPKKKTSSSSKDGLPPNMRFSRAASYNNPHEMFPSASKLFSGMNSVAGNVARKGNATNGAGKDEQAKKDAGLSVVAEEEGNFFKNLYLIVQQGQLQFTIEVHMN